MSLGQGIPVVSPAWILDSSDQGTFLDPWNYILHDQYSEKLFDFDLKSTLGRKTDGQRFLEGFQIYISEANKAFHVTELEEVIKFHGGKIQDDSNDDALDIAIVENYENELREMFKEIDKVKLFNRRLFMSYMLQFKIDIK